MIVDFLFKSKRLKSPTYLDIGAYHPWKLNNTAIFYLKGARGTNIEPNPEMFDKFKIERPKDLNLNVGIGTKDGVLEYYMFDSATLNTFSKVESDRIQDQGHRLVDKRSIAVRSIKSLIEEGSIPNVVDYVSLDVEGLDMEVLQMLQLDQEPKVICVETLEYLKSGVGRKKNEIAGHLLARGYLIYADTFINTIFVHKDFLNS